MILIIINCNANNMKIKITKPNHQHHQRMIINILMKVILKEKENCWKKQLQAKINKTNQLYQ